MNEPTMNEPPRGFAPSPASIGPGPGVGMILHWNIGHDVWRPLLVMDVNPEFPLQLKGFVWTLLEDSINVDALPAGTEACKIDRTRWEVQAVAGTTFGCWRWPPRV